MTTHTIQITVNPRGAQQGATTVRRALAGVDREAEKTDRTLNKLSKRFSALKSGLAGLGLGVLVAEITRVNMSFQSMQTSLRVATGSAAQAGRTFEALQKFAEATPYSVDEATKAFIKLKNLGLDPSRDALTSYGNTASSMGKSLMDMIEAVADASTGEFERLKEFGIKSASEGKKVTFTFQGVKTTVANNAAAIEGYLRNIGKTSFAGGMELQSKTLGGVMSTLQDKISALAVAFGEGGFAPAMQSAIEKMSEGTGGLEAFAREAGKATGTLLGGFVKAVIFVSDHLAELGLVLSAFAARRIAEFASSIGATAVTAMQRFTAVANGTTVATNANTAAAGANSAAVNTLGTSYSRLAAQANAANLALARSSLPANFSTLPLAAQNAALAASYRQVAQGAVQTTASATGAVRAMNLLRAAGAGVAALFGGPLGIAIFGLAGAYYLYTKRQEETYRSTNELKEATEKLNDVLSDPSASQSAINQARALSEEKLRAAMATRDQWMEELKAQRVLKQGALAQVRSGDRLGMEMGNGRFSGASRRERQLMGDLNTINEQIIEGQTQSLRARGRGLLPFFEKMTSGEDPLASNTIVGATGGGADDAKKKDDDALKRLQQYLKEKKREVELAGMSTLEAEKQRELDELRKLAEDAGIKRGSERLGQLESQVGELLDQKRLLDSLAESQRIINDLNEEGLSTMRDLVAELDDTSRLRDRYRELDPYDFSRDTGRTMADAMARFNADRAAIKMNTNMTQEEKDIRLEALNRAVAETAREFKDRHLDAVSNIASAFGGRMGDAVNRVVAILRSINAGDFDGTQAGGKLGAITGLITSLTGGRTGGFAKTVGKEVEKAFNSDAFKKPLASLKGGFGEFKEMFSSGNFGQMFGKAFAGVQQGQTVDGVFKALGIKSSKLGAQIGGGIGNAIGGPIGGWIGSALGGIVGGMFKKTPKASATSSTDAFGEINIGKATGSKKLRAQVDQITGGFESGLKNIQQMLGAQIAANVNLGTLGARKGKFTFDPTGSGRTKGAGVQKFTSAEEAMEAAMKAAIGKGLFTGISDFSQRVLRAAKDLDQAATLAAKYETIVKELTLIDDPITGPMKLMAAEFDKLRRQMIANGATTEELANVERYYTKAKKDALEDQLSDLQDFKKRLSGEGSGVTAFARLNTALGEFSKFEADIRAGKAVDQSKFTELGQSIFDLGRQVYGTATSQFQNDIRGRLTAATEMAIANVTNASAAAAEAAKTADTQIVSAVDTQTAVLGLKLDLISERLLAINGTVASNNNTVVASGGGGSIYRNGERYSTHYL